MSLESKIAGSNCTEGCKAALVVVFAVGCLDLQLRLVLVPQIHLVVDRANLMTEHEHLDRKESQMKRVIRG